MPEEITWLGYMVPKMGMMEVAAAEDVDVDVTLMVEENVGVTSRIVVVMVGIEGFIKTAVIPIEGMEDMGMATVVIVSTEEADEMDGRIEGTVVTTTGTMNEAETGIGIETVTVIETEIGIETETEIGTEIGTGIGIGTGIEIEITAVANAGHLEEIMTMSVSEADGDAFNFGR